MTLLQTFVEEGFDFMLATSSFEGQCWTPLLVGYLLSEEIASASKEKSDMHELTEHILIFTPFQEQE